MDEVRVVCVLPRCVSVFSLCDHTGKKMKENGSILYLCILVLFSCKHLAVSA